MDRFRGVSVSSIAQSARLDSPTHSSPVTKAEAERLADVYSQAFLFDFGLNEYFGNEDYNPDEIIETAEFAKLKWIAGRRLQGFTDADHSVRIYKGYIVGKPYFPLMIDVYEYLDLKETSLDPRGYGRKLGDTRVSSFLGDALTAVNIQKNDMAQIREYAAQRIIKEVPEGEWNQFIIDFPGLPFKTRMMLASGWKEALEVNGLMLNEYLNTLSPAAKSFAELLSRQSSSPMVDSDQRRLSSEDEDESTSAKTEATKDEKVGGIDMNSIDLDREGTGVDIQFDPAQLQEIIDAGIDGFAPVIINITPLPSILPLLGLEPQRKEEEVAWEAS